MTKQQRRSVPAASAESFNLFSVIKQAFIIKKNPFPWWKAIQAGICMATPPFIGLLVGHLQEGLLMGIGAFTFLYMFNEPYAQRAKKLFFIMIGIALSVGLGTLLTPHPYGIALMLGLIGAIVTFIFGALKIPGPAAVFFVLTFSMTTAMPVDPSLAPIRAGLVLVGGALSWLVAMAGSLVNFHGPEITAMKQVYRQLATLLDTVGTSNFASSRQQTLLTIRNAEDTLLAGYIPRQKSAVYKQLYLLYERANIIFSEVLEFYTDADKKLPAELGDSLRKITESIGDNDLLTLQEIDPTDELMGRLVTNIRKAEAVVNKSPSMMDRDIAVKKRPLKDVLSDCLHRNSIVFIYALRYGFILMIAALIAFSFNFDRSYWIPLSCAAVMLGTTIMTTFHRAIQRTFGTIIGVLIASALLSTHPDGIFIVLIILTLTFLTEAFIVRNYALAVFFITPNAIFMAENTTQIHNVSYFATARITDIFIGCAIGLIGVLLTSRRSASSRLPHLIAKTIRTEIQFLVLLFSEETAEQDFEGSKEMRKMHSNLSNLRVVYTTALGEIPKDKKALEFIWPVIFSIEQLGYLLESSSRRKQRPVLKDEDLAQLLLVFEIMAKASEQRHAPNTRYIPEITGYTQIRKEIADLQQALQSSARAPIM